MAISDLTGQRTSKSFQNLLQISSSGALYDGTGSLVTNIIASSSYAPTASYAVNTTSSSYASTASYAANATTASYALNTDNIFLRNKTRPNTTESIVSNQSIFNPFNLEILTSSIFIIDSTSGYYVMGDLTNKGQIIVDGTLKIGGALYNSGSIIGNGIIV
jgi:hypothetical protein